MPCRGMAGFEVLVFPHPSCSVFLRKLSSRTLLHQERLTQRLAQWVEHATLDLRVVSSPTTLDIELTLKKKKAKKKRQIGSQTPSGHNDQGLARVLNN